MTADAGLRELLARVIEEFEEEGDAALDRACAERPELATALRRRFESLRRVGLVGAATRGASANGDDPFPERLGDFRLLRRLGGGGMGVVYLAEQESLQRRVALKLVRPELLYFPSSRDRFRREVELVAKLAHPGVVPVHAFDVESELPWFAMEWVDGVGLDDLLRALAGRDPATLTGREVAELLGVAGAEPDGLRELVAGGWAATCVRLVRQAALALAHAHERGVVHRDVKPSNLMLTRDGRVRLVDFGLASSDDVAPITRSSSQLGSLPYSSPEQVEQGVAAVTARSDVYALGVVLYELLTLTPPYRADSAEAIRRRILDGQPPPPRTHHRRLSWDVETVCLVAIERDPARRYATAVEFARDLQRVLDSEPIAARRASPLLRLRRFVRRRPAVAVGALLGGLLLVGGPAIWAWQEHRLGAQLTAKNGELERTVGQLAQAKQRLDAELVAEKSANDAARRSATRARQAVVEFLGQVGGDLLANVPHAETVRRDLLARAAQHFEAIARDSAGDLDVALETANAYRLLGARYGDLGDESGAARSLDRALELVDGARTAAPDDARLARMRADVLYERGGHRLERQVEVALAATQLDEAVATYRDLLARGEDVAWCTMALGLALTTDAQAHALRGERDVAIRLDLEAVRTLEAAAHATPPRAQASDGLLVARSNLAATLEEAGRTDEAEKAYRALVDELAKEGGTTTPSADRRLAAAAASSNLGLLLARLERQEEAEPYLRDAVGDYERLVRDFPAVALPRRELAKNLRALADVVTTIRGAKDEEVEKLRARAKFVEGDATAAPSATDRGQ